MTKPLSLPTKAPFGKTIDEADNLARAIAKQFGWSFRPISVFAAAALAVELGLITPTALDGLISQALHGGATASRVQLFARLLAETVDTARLPMVRLPALTPSLN